MGSLHPATRYRDGRRDRRPRRRPARRPGAAGRRAATSAITWYGGELVVRGPQDHAGARGALGDALPLSRKRPIAPCICRPSRCADARPARRGACASTRSASPCPASCCPHRKAGDRAGQADWSDASRPLRSALRRGDRAPRHGPAAVAHGLLKDFGLKRGRGGQQRRPRLAQHHRRRHQRGRHAGGARRELQRHQGGVCVVDDGKVLAMVPLPIAGLLSDKRVGGSRRRSPRPEDRMGRGPGARFPIWASTSSRSRSSRRSGITDKGLVLVPQMRLVPLFEEAGA